MTVLDSLVDDLAAESDALDALVACLPAEQWATPTPAPGWTIAHQIGHLLWTDRVALMSITDEAAFLRLVAEAQSVMLTFVDDAAEREAATAPETLLADWRRGRTDLHAALRAVPEGRKLAWFGPPMSAPSMATARLMETWAHGLDVADALGTRIAPSARLKAAAKAAAVSSASAGRMTSRFGMTRRPLTVSTGWWVGPSSPTPTLSCVKM